MSNIFSRILGNARKQRQRDTARERECMEAVAGVLERFNCRLEPVIKADERAIYADVQITALPEPPNASRTAVEPPKGSGTPPTPEDAA